MLSFYVVKTLELIRSLNCSKPFRTVICHISFLCVRSEAALVMLNILCLFVKNLNKRQLIREYIQILYESICWLKEYVRAIFIKVCQILQTNSLHL